MNAASPDAAPGYLTARDLQERFRLSRSTFYRYVAEGYFPSPVRIGPRCVRWPIRTVEEFEARLAADRGGR